MNRLTRTTFIPLVATALVLGGCSEAQSNADSSATSTLQAVDTVTVTDNEGEKEVPLNPERVAAPDGRAAELLESWGVETVAPNAGPDVIFADGDIASGNIVLNFAPRDDEPFDRELIRQALEMGDIFGKQDEAEQIVGEFTQAVMRARETYNPAQTVEISSDELAQLADVIGFTPADGTPDWLLTVHPQDSDADHVYVAPEGAGWSIVTYTEILNDLSDQMQ